MINNLQFRKANNNDYPLLSNLLSEAHLPVDGIKEHLDNFIVLQSGNDHIGVIGMEVYGNAGLLRSFAILPEYRNNGLGHQLYSHLISNAKEKGLSKIFLLTETAEKFFTKQGFQKINRNDADDAVKNSVEFKSVCPQSAVCMMLYLTNEMK